MYHLSRGCNSQSHLINISISVPSDVHEGGYVHVGKTECDETWVFDEEVLSWGDEALRQERIECLNHSPTA